MSEIKNILLKEKSKFNAWMLVLFGVFLILAYLELNWGSSGVGIKDLFSPSQEYSSVVFYEIRIPRLLTALIVGASLSFSGLILQTVFRNPLVGPSVLGISSGASLGVALVTLAGYSTLADQDSSPKVMAALIFALAILFLLFSVANRFKDNVSVLIVGMLISYLAGAVVDILIYVSDNEALKEYTLWGMGSFARMTYTQIIIMFSLLIVAYLVVYNKRNLMNQYLIGELQEIAPKKKKRLVFLLLVIAGVITSFVTAYCGPIAFIGIAIPNLLRFVLKITNHKYLLLGSIVLGSVVAVLCDLISSMPWSTRSLPVNAVTSLFGIPIIIIMVFKSRYKGL